MIVVLDGLAARGESTAIVFGHLLAAWAEIAPEDELHLVAAPDSGLAPPPTVAFHTVELGERRYVNRLKAQASLIPRLCRSVGADALLASIPTTTVTPLPCARVVIAHDLRHELRPTQFGSSARWLRHISHGIGFRQADGIVAVSERTRGDLLASRPWLAGRVLRAAPLGSDHVVRWPGASHESPYALTFGQWGNKNPALVVDAWAQLRDESGVPPLLVVGLDGPSRELLAARVHMAGLEERVVLSPWLEDEQFRTRFASASLVVFPSDFEGFGLPAVEAMRLGIPLVVSRDPALLEVTAGHAAVSDALDPLALAAAVKRALAISPEALAAAREHAAGYTWSRMAEQTRAAVAEAIARR